MASQIFSGSSRFATDFSQLMERSVAIASLPLTQLKNDGTKLAEQSKAVSAISAKVAAFRSALNAVDQARTAIKTELSDGTVLSAVTGSNALSGTYRIQVVSAGSQTLTASKAALTAVADPDTGNISSSLEYTLTVGGEEYDIALTSAKLSSLVAAINASDAPVQAVMLNLGTAETPDYRLSVESRRLGDVDIQLHDGAADLLDEISTGSLASYRINGLPTVTPLTSDSATDVEIGPGISVNFLKAGTSDLVVSADNAALTEAFAGLSRAYSDLLLELDQHRGEATGALGGQSLVGEVSQSLRRMFSYAGSGDINGPARLGLSFSDKGVLTFDAAQFDSLDPEAISEFLGSIDGTGFLEAADSVLDGLDSIATGVLPTATESIRRQVAANNAAINDQEDRIGLLKERIAGQMAAADALIATLEQKAQYITGLFESMAAENSQQ